MKKTEIGILLHNNTKNKTNSLCAPIARICIQRQWWWRRQRQQVENEFTIFIWNFSDFEIRFTVCSGSIALCWDFMVNFVDLYAYCITNGLPKCLPFPFIASVFCHATRQQCNRTKIGRRRRRSCCRLRPTLHHFLYSIFEIRCVQNVHAHTPTNTGCAIHTGSN